MFRQSLLTIFVSISICCGASAQTEKAEVNLEYVSKIAAERAKQPFHSPAGNVPDILKPEKLDYDKYRKIRFRTDRSFWLADSLPFRAEFFHPGYIYQEPVRMFEFTKTHVQRIRFVRDWFNYSDLKIENQIPADTGYAGFKASYQLNKPGDYAEILSFLGKSYFRMLGKEQRYGASARGLALDTGEYAQPEEFPLFTDFWLGKPAAGDSALLVYAVLDSVTCTGAYQFRIIPGETTVADIDAVLFFREPEKIAAASKDRAPLKTIGVAPLTSMFWFGESSERKFDDYRGEVHDSDGLLLALDGGEKVWRPLNNPTVMRHSTFTAHNLRGFGLLQRDRNPDRYGDVTLPYEVEPSMWIKPKSDWGDGEVHLVEIPTTYDGLDNVTAFWNPKVRPAPLEPFRIGYELLWTRERDFQLSENQVVATRIGLAAPDSPKRQVHIDFAGPGLAAIPEAEPPTAAVSCSDNAAIYETQVLPNPNNHGWRVVVKFEPKEGNKDPVDLHCVLQRNGAAVSETWAYQWSPL